MANPVWSIVVGVDPWGGRSKAVIVDHAGPTSYVAGGESITGNSFGGANVLGLSSFSFVSQALTNSQNYQIVPYMTGTGIRSSVKLKWVYAGASGEQGVNSVYASGAGSGMTVGTVALVFSGGGGSGAAGTFTALTATTGTIQITSPGTGYTSIPTVSAATGGTPPTLVATVGSNEGGEGAAATNLNAEIARLLVIGG